jgi:hypothetical protein
MGDWKGAQELSNEQDYLFLGHLAPIEFVKRETIKAKKKDGGEYKRESIIFHSKASKKYYRFLAPFSNGSEHIKMFWATITAWMEVDAQSNLFETMKNEQAYGGFTWSRLLP